MVANPHARDRIFDYLEARGGEITSDTGQNLVSVMGSDLGYGSPTGLTALLARLETEGLVEREVRGKRTYRVALAGEWARSGRAAAAPRAQEAANAEPARTASKTTAARRTSEPVDDLTSVSVRVEELTRELADAQRRIEQLEQKVRDLSTRRRRFGRRAA